MTLTLKALREQAKRTTADKLNELCEPHGFGCQYEEPDGEGGGNCFTLWSNQHSPGVEGEYETSLELSEDVREVMAGRNPL